MDLNLFLECQPWLGPAPAAAAGAESAKRRRASPFECRCAFHVSLAEQYQPAGAVPLRGATAPDSVFIRVVDSSGDAGEQLQRGASVELRVRVQTEQLHLQQPGGSSSAASSEPAAAFALQFGGQQSARQLYIDPSQVRSVVASAAIHERACELDVGARSTLVRSEPAAPQQQDGRQPEQQPGQQPGQQQQQQQLQFVTLIMPHVCLDLYTRQGPGTGGGGAEGVDGGASGSAAAIEGLSAFAASLSIAAAAASRVAPTQGGVQSAPAAGEAAGSAALSWAQQARSAAELTQQLCDAAPPAHHMLQALVSSVAVLGSGRVGIPTRDQRACMPGVHSCCDLSSQRCVFETHACCHCSCNLWPSSTHAGPLASTPAAGGGEIAGAASTSRYTAYKTLVAMCWHAYVT